MAEESERLQPKLLDFGIAKLVGEALPAGSITDTGIMLGSPDYMSPEQARGQIDLDHRTDLWSFCVVLYEAVTGITPFQGVNYNALMRAIIDEAPLPIPSELGIEQALQEIIFRGLSKDRDQRPSSVQALGRELATWLKSRGITEDVTGSALATKWTGRMPQRSVPVISEELPVVLPSPRPTPSGDTLVSASDYPLPASRGAHESQARLVGMTATVTRKPWAWLAAGVALAAGAVWAGVSTASSPEPHSPNGPSHAALPGAAAAPVVLQAPPVEPSASAAAVQLAVTPPSPSLNPVPSTAPHITKGAQSAHLPRVPKSPPPSQSATAKPAALEGRDDAHELLQAY
jgi:serine/threonine-protein kinase